MQYPLASAPMGEINLCVPNSLIRVNKITLPQERHSSVSELELGRCTLVRVDQDSKRTACIKL